MLLYHIMAPIEIELVINNDVSNLLLFLGHFRCTWMILLTNINAHSFKSLHGNSVNDVMTSRRREGVIRGSNPTKSARTIASWRN